MNRRHFIGLSALLAGVTSLPLAARAAAQPSSPSTTHARKPELPDLHIRDWGNGPPIVLLNAWGVPSDFWHYHFMDLAKAGFRVISYDRRGHGRSSEGSAYDYDTLADDLARVLEQLDVMNATLVGYSMSGGEAVRYLARYGSNRTARLVLASATTPFIARSPDNPTGIPIEMLRVAGEAIEKDYPKWLATGEQAFWLGKVSPELQQWAKSLMLQTSVPAAAACYRAMIETDFREDLRALNLPSLVIHGAKDASAPFPLTAAKSAELLSNSHLSVYDDAPHGLPLTHRQRFVEELTRFAS